MGDTGPKLAVVPREVSKQTADRLDSWKEIASYLKRGTRTVQRWEREEGLPVRRLLHEKLGSVYAYRSDLDAWWSKRGHQLASEIQPEADNGASIAVLPFADLSQEKDQGYFCDGMAEEILNALGRVAELRVSSRTSSFQFRPPAPDSREIGAKLRVRTILEGSVRKAGDRLRITLQLVDAKTGFQLWSERYDRDVRDIFVIQDEVAENVVRALELTLTQKEKAALQRSHTPNVAAYDLYLRAREYYSQYDPKGIECALKMFMRAIQLDQEYADAYAGLADCWSYVYLYSDRSDVVRDQADWASRRALEMNPESAQAHASRGFSLSTRGETEEARAAFDAALRLGPDLFEAHYFYARHCFVIGELEKAASLYEGAQRVRPTDYQSPLLVAQIYDDLGRPGDAMAARRKGIQLAGKHLEFHPDDTRALYMSANGLAALGDRERARETAERALNYGGEEGMVLYNVGCIYSMLDLAEPALDCLERAVGRGLTQKGWYMHDSNLDSLRKHIRFQKLLEKL